MPRPRRRDARESFVARTLLSFPACVAVTSFAALLAGCGAKEEPTAPALESESAVESGSAAASAAPPVRVAAAGESILLPAVPPLTETEPGENSIVARLPGTYTRESYGTRTLTVREDGTATMTVDVDPFYQWMVGKRITVQIDWDLTGDPEASYSEGEGPGVHFESVSGTPKESFDSVTKLFGSERDWTILSADDETLVLHSPEDDETEIWTRKAGGLNDQAGS